MRNLPSNPNEPADILQHAERLMTEGKYTQALETVEVLSSLNDLTTNDQVSIDLLKSRILICKGDFQEGLELSETVFQEVQHLRIALAELDASIIKADALENLGKYDESLEVITQCFQLLNTLEQLTTPTIENQRASLLYLKGRNYWRKGELDQSFENLKESLAISKDIDNKLVMTLSLRNLGIISSTKGDMDQALNYYQESLTVSDEFGFFKGRFYSRFNIGWIYTLKGDLDKALECFQQILTLSEKLDYQKGMALSHNGIAMVYRSKIDLDKSRAHFQQELAIHEEFGDLPQVANTISIIGFMHYYNGDLRLALKSHKRSLEMFEQLEDELSKAQALMGIADVYRCRGELAEALSYYQKTLDICKSLNAHSANPYRYALRYMGKIYYEKKEIDIALECYLKALDFAEKMADTADIVYLSFFLILISLEAERTEHIENLLKKSHQTVKIRDMNYLFTSTVDKLSQATVLKSSKRIAARFKAQQLLEEIVEEGSDFEIWLTAMLFLCDMLLDELQAFGETKIIEEIEKLVHKMESIAQKQRSLSILIELDILRAKLAFILGSSENAFNLLEKAQELASAKGMALLVHKATLQETTIKSKFEKWEEFLHQNASLRKKIEQTQIQDYLKNALAIAKAGQNGR